MRKLKICSFDYVPLLYETLNTLRKFDINLLAKPPSKLKGLIQRKIDPIPNKEIAGVYYIPFKMEKQNELSYIGMTTRKFKERLGEHMRSVKFNRQKYKIRFRKYKFIIPTSDYYTLRIRKIIGDFEKRE